MLRRLACLCTVVAVPAAVIAQQPSAANVTTNRLPEIVVTADRIPTPVKSVGSDVTVITSNELEQAQIRSLPDALRNVPGLAVVQSGQPGGQTSVFMRGLNSNQTLFLLDGARFNNPINGFVTLANLMPEQVDRIEVVEGPQSTLYGADALGGVVNIVTRKGQGPPEGSVAVEAGSYNTIREMAGASGSWSNLTAAGSVWHESTDNRFPNSDFDALNASATIGYRVLDNLHLDTTVFYAKADAGEPGAITNGTPSSLTERLHDEILFARPGVDWELSDWWQQNFFVAETHEELVDQGVPSSASVSRSDLVQAEWQNTFCVADWNTLIAGGDWYDDRGSFNLSGATPFDKSVYTTAGYVEDRATFWQRLDLTAGARGDEHTQFGGDVTYHGSGVLRFDETGTRLKFSGGTAFHAPTLSDLYLSEPAFSFFPNPNLQPEKSVGWDAGIEQDIASQTMLGARYFENDIHNLIEFAAATNGTFTLANVDRARTRGLEVTGQTTLLTNVTLWANYTWLIEARDLTTGAALLRRPEHSGAAGADWRFLRRFLFHTDATFTGSREDIDPVTFNTVRNSGYIKWDVGLTADVTRHFQLFGRIENLLDDQYEEAKGFPALGRVFYAGGRALF